MPERICGIYCIENLVNGKKYIGQTLDFASRKRTHKSSLKNGLDSIYLQSSYNKHGSKKFKMYLIEECKKEELNQKEIYYINFYKTNDRRIGYNLSSGGDKPPSWSGKKHKPETLEKMSLSAMGNERWLGRSHTDKTISKMKILARGRKNKNHSSEFIGVSKRKDSGKWVANITFNGKRIYIGAYIHEIDAAKAYDKTAVLFYGSKEKINFPQDYE